MAWPQITWIALAAIGIGVNMALHGKPRGNYSVWSSLIGVGLSVWLLVAGGFFSGGA